MTKHRIVLAVVVTLFALERPLRPASSGTGAVPELYAQSLARAFERRFAAEDLSYLLLDARTGETMAARWEDPNEAVPMGSLLKPFTALAWGETRAFRYPRHVCHGERAGCWLPRGHGRIGLAEAVAHSCNAYFRALAIGVRTQDVSAMLQRYGLAGLEPGATAAERLGAGYGWRTTPAAMARAYAQLATRADDPGAREVVRGMRLSAEMGTGSAVGRALPGDTALVKTGTAPCSHAQRAPGDGFAIVLYPAASPRFALLASRHGKPGSEAAAAAGEILRVIARGE